MKNIDGKSTPESGPSPPPLPGSAPRWMPKVLFAVVTLATLGAALFYVVARPNLAGKKQGAETLLDSPERAMAAKLIPPLVPDEENFAATPFLAGALERRRGHDDAQDWPDDFSRADQWPRVVPLLRDSPIGRSTGRLLTDLVAWQKSFEQSQSLGGTNNEEIVVADPPDAAANAQAAVAVLNALQPYEPVLNELRAASRRPHARCNIHYDLDNPWATLLPQLAIVKRTCQLVRLQTSAEIAAGQAEAALRDAILMLRLVDLSKDEPTLISQLVRVACLHLALQPVWEGLVERRWSEPQLQALQSQFQQFDFLADLEHAMQSERAWGNLTIAIARDRRTPDFLLSMVAENGKAKPWQEEANRAFVTCPRDWFDQEQRNYNRLFDERILSDVDRAARRVRPGVVEANSRYVENAVRDKKSLLKNHMVFASELLVAPAKAHLKMAESQAVADFAVIACALERHRLAQGEYPQTLSALAPRYLDHLPSDLIDGQPLRYQRSADGSFLLYSVGWNESDEQGEPAFLASGRGTEIKDGDWVWRYPARK